MRSLNGKAVLPFALALAAGAVAPQHAFAQFFFRPFAYSYSYQAPPAEAPRFASRRAVASILGREGYRLVGPLGHRGEQIVATGVSRREGEIRFIIDPYEGRILRAVRLGPPPAYDRGPRYGGGYGPAGVDPYAPPAAGAPSVGRSGPAARDLGNEGYPDANGARQAPGGASLGNAAPGRSTKQRARTARTGAAPVAQPELKSNIDAAKTPAASAPAQEASAPTPNAATETPDKAAADGAAAQTGETAKTARAAEPSETARGSQPSAERSTQPAPVSAENVSKEAPSAAPPAETPVPSPARNASAPAKRAAAARGSSRRAIVPPRASNGVIVAPAASAPAVSKPADAATTAKTPAGAATTNAGG
ncbi:MAG: hypothetical protein AB7F41_01390 [Methylocystis sp.]|uniref:hypothetical protein n=1 Tax=Methylocystis sp. TaxID=1911079 RepID=UPI003D1070EE